ncbi:MAG: CoA transferase, partial [Methylotenera sp.]
IALTEAWTRVRSAEEALRGLAAADVPCARYRRIADLADDPQLQHRHMMTEVVDGFGPLKVPNAPFLFSETHAAVRPEVANLGQHNDAVLREELGMDDADIGALRAAGVFGAEAASRHYYKTSAAKLSSGQAAKLAAMIPNPRFYDKHQSTSYLNRRTATIQARMRFAEVP